MLAFCAAKAAAKPAWSRSYEPGRNPRTCRYPAAPEAWSTFKRNGVKHGGRSGIGRGCRGRLGAEPSRPPLSASSGIRLAATPYGPL